MFGFIKKMFIVLLTSLANASNHTKYISLSNQKSEIQPTFINLHPKEYNQELHYYPFIVNLERIVESSNTLNDLSYKVCVPNKTEDLNIYVYNMIIGKNELKILAKDISWKCKYKFDGRKCNSNQKRNNNLISFCILLAFLLIAIVLLIAVSVYCNLIKYKSKPKTFITISRHK